MSVDVQVGPLSRKHYSISNTFMATILTYVLLCVPVGPRPTYAIPPEGGRHNVAICLSVCLSHAPTSKTTQMAMAGWELPNLKWGVRVATTYD